MYDTRDQAVPEEMIFVLDKFEIVDQAIWDKFSNNPATDELHVGIVSYAARWAGLMEARLARGESLQDIAESTSHQAIDGDLSGGAFMAAISTLVKCWKHGKELRAWYYNKY